MTNTDVRTAGVGVCLLPNLTKLIEAGLSQSSLLPAYGGESAGLDLINAGPDLIIPACRDFDFLSSQGETGQQWQNFYFKTLMPTGIKVAIPRGFVGLIQERGSIVKSVLKVRAGVIDPGYTGEVFVNMVNLSSTTTTIKAGEKSPFQLIVVPALSYNLVSDEDYNSFTLDSKRQSGQIGSSDK